ncbi:LuxR C-terminal-related transcriptional regulator [Viridibacillus arvi]|uniref:LuxR C-terminal-related transcriptional regulator n=1 Tax=Viridibacillus arvi TaxID=263475 RepID=UPI00187B1151|nr:LuxR C-terminal-related transcriptional regulator [Viridibacillus sp. JNUCC-6]QOV12322.1 hypothetical protein JNUCC6_06070 [Viridibacillus sp. JNUCC-6]
MQMVLLRSKTTMPQALNSAIERERLYDLLGYDRTRKITFVRSPAGYGKTTILSQWFSQFDEPVAWLSIEVADNDPIRFWKYVIHSVTEITKNNIDLELASLFASQEPSAFEFLIDSFLNEMSLVKQTISIVLDDYHLIENATIHKMMVQFIEYLPSNVQIYITSRADVPLPIAKWRAKSWLREIGMEQLRFTYEEIQQFYEKKNCLYTDVSMLQHVLKKTEGWVTGIQLTELSLNSSTINDFNIDALNGAHPYIADFLLQDILAALSPSIQDFLIRTSILKSLDPLVCNALTNRSDSLSILSELEKKGLFIVRLNSTPPVYRYHHLFAEALQIELKNRYSEELVASIITETATLLQDKGDTISAIELAISKQDYELAVSWITTYLVDIFTSGQTSTFIGWVKTLRMNHYPIPYEMLVMDVIALISTLKFEEAVEIMTELEQKQVTEKWMDLEENLGVASIYETVKAYAIFGMGGDIEQATEIVQRQLEKGRVGSRWDNIPMQYNTFEHKILRTSIGSKGKFWPFEKSYPLVKLFRETEFKDDNMTAYSYGSSAESLYEKGFIDAASSELKIAIQYGHKFRDPGLFIPMYLLKAQIYIKNNNFIAAHAFLKNSMETVKEKHWIKTLRTKIAHCYLLEGNLLQAEQELIMSRSRQPFWLLVNARLLMAKSQASDALSSIMQVKTKALQEMQISTIIEATVLEAICEKALGNDDSAMMALHEALLQGAPYEYVRTFLDEKASIPLLKAYLKMRKTKNDPSWNTVPLTYVTRLLHDIQSEDNALDSLTPREQEVFSLLADGATNREIADRLFLTEGTVRVYLTTIYSKLGVNSRAKAILLKQ